MSTVTTTIAASVINTLSCTSGASYEENRQGLGTLTLGTTPALFGQASSDQVYQTFLGFDTSAIPSNAVIKDAYIQYESGGYFLALDFHFYMALFDYGSAVTVADWQTPTMIGNLVTAGILHTSDIQASGYDTNIMTNKTFIDNINLTGITKVMIYSERTLNGDNPSANEYAILSGADLIVTYEIPPTDVPNTPKKYEYKIFDQDGNFLETITDATGDGFSYIDEINTNGSEAVITLGREAGSLDNVDLNYKVEVYCFDRQRPNGLLIYTGRINRYSDLYSDAENVKLYLESYGAELNDYILEDSVEVAEISQTSSNTGYDFGLTGTKWLAQSIAATSDSYLALDVLFSQYGPGEQVIVALYNNNASTSLPNEQLATIVVSSAKVGKPTHLRFNSEGSFVVGDTYWIVVQSTVAVKSTSNIIKYQNSSVYASGRLYESTDSGSTWSTLGTSDLYFVLYSGTTTTELTFSGVDAAIAFKQVLDNFNSRGGRVTYEFSGLEFTGVNFNYTFNSATIKEALDAILAACPYGFYMWLDQGNNLMYLRKRSAEREIDFAFGRDIKTIEPIRILDTVCNVVYFTGGDDGSGDNLYRKYSNQDSIDFWRGIRARSVVDNRVTVVDTAELMANRILDANIAPELRTMIQVNDSDPVLNDLGYDIETLNAGVVCGFTNVGEADRALWDVAEWDVAYWDYNLKQLGTLDMQIVRLEYYGSYVALTVSSIPQDVFKLVEEVSRKLNKIYTQSNPSSPS